LQEGLAKWLFMRLFLMISDCNHQSAKSCCIVWHLSLFILLSSYRPNHPLGDFLLSKKWIMAKSVAEFTIDRLSD